jgi:hypothetical protein
MVCFLFTFLALLVAFLDLAIVQRRTREQQRALFEEALKGIARRPEGRAGLNGEREDESH